MIDMTADNAEMIESWFDVKDFIGLWPDILNRYTSMGFTDPLTDEQRIREFSYISEQLHKYVSRKHKDFMACKDNLPMMLSKIDNALNTAREKADSRKEIVYISMRDDWLIGLYSLVSMAIEETKQERTGTEEIDEWI